MSKKWLFDVIKDGTLQDNQSYSAKEGEFKNSRQQDEGCFLEERGKNKRIQIHTQEGETWEFLNSISVEIKDALGNKNKRRDALILFNEKEYEHNAGGTLFEISGTNARNFTLTTGNMVGFVKKGDYSLIINSRFGEDFLKYIVADADGFLKLEDIGGESSGEEYKWLLAYIWNTKLKNAYRLGLPKKYVTKDDRTTRVRGTIDTVDYFQNHKSGKYLCSYREHSYNSPALSLFIEAYKEVIDFPFCQQTRGIYNTLLIANQGVKRSRQDILKTKHFTNQYYSDYNVLIDLSKRVIRNRELNFDSQNDSSAFLFDVSMLFEYFIRKLIARSGIHVESKTKHRWEIPSGAYPDSQQGSYKRKLEPDLVFESSDGIYVFDVKYKYFDQKYGVKREDLFQLHTYIGRYGHETTIKGCGFIYPISDERWGTLGLDKTQGIISDVIRQQGREIPFYVLFLKIPLNSREEGSSKNFNSEMSKSCSTFVSTLKSRVMSGSA